MKKQIRIPTILGIILTLIGIFLTTLLIKQTTRLFIKASPTALPKNIRLTNLSDTKFTISFITTESTVAFLSSGESKSLGKIFQDDRDVLSGKSDPKTTHYITVTNLKPETSYYFKIGSDRKIYGAKNKTDKLSLSCLDFLEIDTNGEPFILKTLPSKMVSCRENPLNGEVATKLKLPALGTIVCLEIESLLPISDYVKSNGKWVIPCYNLTLSNSRDFLPKLTDGQKETLYIDGGQEGQTKVTNITGNDNPVPLISLDKEIYDFTQISPTAIKVFTTGPTTTGQPTTAPIVILNSPQGSIADDLPTFRGRGKPNQVIKIEVRSETPLNATVVIDENGNWSWTPPKNLSPGDHTVTITAIDEYGNQHLITKTFTVTAGNPLLPIYSGTQAAQPTTAPTNPPTGGPTPTEATPYASPTPTLSLEEPTPTPATNSSLLNTANEIPIFYLLTIAVISFTIGLRSFFLKKWYENH